MNSVEPIRDVKKIQKMKEALAYYGSERDVFCLISELTVV